MQLDLFHVAHILDSEEKAKHWASMTHLEHAQNVTWYQPYWMFIPTDQVKILELWDEINLPHKEKKQVYGSIFTIVGIEVNANALTMSMP